MLLSTAQLQEKSNDANLLLFDCRHDLLDHAKGARVYREGHIPGARFAAVETDLSGTKTGRNGRHPLPRPEYFAAFLNRHGATADHQLVAYDDIGGQYATRFWWLARWIGLRQVAVLDGGYPKWLAEGRPVTTEVPRESGGGSIVARPDAGHLVTTGDVAGALGSGKLQVIDARAPERFRGETEPIDPVAGHIPGAQNRFFKSNLRPDLTFRPPEELRREFEGLLAGRAPSTVAHQCGSGVTACVNLFAMELAGLPGAKLYAGSWSEWIADPARPIAKG